MKVRDDVGARGSPLSAIAGLDQLEQRFREGDFEGCLAMLAPQALAQLDIPSLDRALPIALMSATAVKGIVRAERVLRLLRQLTATDAARLALLQVYEAEARPDPTDRSALADEALRVLREHHCAPVAQHRALGVLLSANVDLGYGLVSTLLDEASELEQTVDLVALNDSVTAQIGWYAYQTGHLSMSRVALRTVREQAIDYREPVIAGLASVHLAAVETYAGRLDLARTHLREWDAAGLMQDSRPPSVLTAQGLVALHERDETPLLTLVTAPTERGSEELGAMVCAALIGLSAARHRRWNEAHHQLARAVQLAEGAGLFEPGRRLWVDLTLGRAFVEVGKTDQAAKIAADLRRMSQGRRALLDGAAARVEGLLAESSDPNKALSLFEESVALLSGADFPAQLVESLLDLARLQHRIRRSDLARMTLRRAAHLAGAISDDLLRDRATNSDLLALRDPLRSLTPRERSVARSAADGLTNRQIAQAQYISVRTVETQLSSAYRKLGIRTRHQLAALVREGKES